MRQFSLVLLLLVLAVTPALAFTPTTYHYTNDNFGASWNQSSGMVNNAVTMVKQDVTKAREFVRETVTRTRQVIDKGREQFRIIRTHGVPQVQEQYTQVTTEATSEWEKAREEWYENKDSYFVQVKDKVKDMIKDNGRWIHKRVQRYIPRVRDVITTLDYEIMNILRRGGF